MLSELLRETDDVEAKRKACLEMRDLLRRALEIVNEVRSGTTASTTMRSSIAFNSHLNSTSASSASSAGAAAGVTNHSRDDEYGENDLGFVSRRGRR